MKTIIRAAALGACAAALCLPVRAADDVTEERANPRHSQFERPVADGIGESDAVGILEEIHQHEIDAAAIAQRKSQNEEVLAFARQMTADHSEAKSRLGTVGIEGSGSEHTLRMREKHRAAIRRLEKLEGAAFDRAYMSQMVDGHTMALEKIDKKIKPAAKTGAFTTYVAELRPGVETHLEHARRIKTELGRK